jgi:hypothetical protein
MDMPIFINPCFWSKRSRKAIYACIPLAASTVFASKVVVTVGHVLHDF